MEIYTLGSVSSGTAENTTKSSKIKFLTTKRIFFVNNTFSLLLSNVKSLWRQCSQDDNDSESESVRQDVYFSR